MARRKGLTIKNIGSESGYWRWQLFDWKVTWPISDSTHWATIIECSDWSFVKIDQKINWTKTNITYKLLTQTERYQYLEKARLLAEKEDKEYADNLISDM